MNEEEKQFITKILKAVDGGDFDGWLSLQIKHRYRESFGYVYIIVGKQVTEELILEVKADPEFYRAHVFPQLGGLQIETT